SCALFTRDGHHTEILSSPTRRASDLPNGAFGGNVERGARELARALLLPSDGARELFFAHPGATGDAQIFGLLVQLLLGAPEEVRSEEHTSELQSRENIVCRLLLEKKK